jgi:hypothetical protein
MTDREMLVACLAAMRFSMKSTHRIDWSEFIRRLEQHLGIYSQANPEGNAK